MPLVLGRHCCGPCCWWCTHWVVGLDSSQFLCNIMHSLAVGITKQLPQSHQSVLASLALGTAAGRRSGISACCSPSNSPSSPASAALSFSSISSSFYSDWKAYPGGPDMISWWWLDYGNTKKKKPTTECTVEVDRDRSTSGMLFTEWLIIYLSFVQDLWF